MDIIFGEVNCCNRLSILEKDESILTDFPGSEKVIKYLSYYFRSPEDCPFGRGNWIIDLFSERDNQIPIICIKLPKEMTKEQVKQFIKPLSDYIKSKHN
jgi:hypothetical protein